MTSKPYTHKDAVPYRPIDWTGLYPPALPKAAVPDHVAIVMDGNGRWANRRGLTRIEGHKAGEAALLDVVAGAVQIGVKLSVYAFRPRTGSARPTRCASSWATTATCCTADATSSTSGACASAGRAAARLWRFVIDSQVRRGPHGGNDTLTLTMCVNYGGRNEITDAVRSIADDVASGRMRPPR